MNKQLDLFNNIYIGCKVRHKDHGREGVITSIDYTQYTDHKGVAVVSVGSMTNIKWFVDNCIPIEG